MPDNIKEYTNYLTMLDNNLDEYFSDQKEFIKCKEGCSICCKSSYYPVSELEYDYIRIGIEEKLSAEQKTEIQQNALELLQERRKFLKMNPNVFEFSYECPFLLDNSCSIYEYRSLLCRSHGLIYQDAEKENKFNVPYCVNLGYNYAGIWDNEKKDLSKEKIKSSGIKTNLKIYDLAYSSLMKNAEGVEFGDVRMLFEWVIFDIPNYEELIAEKEAVV